MHGLSEFSFILITKGGMGEGRTLGRECYGLGDLGRTERWLRHKFQLYFNFNVGSGRSVGRLVGWSVGRLLVVVHRRSLAAACCLLVTLGSRSRSRSHSRFRSGLCVCWDLRVVGAAMTTASPLPMTTTSTMTLAMALALAIFCSFVWNTLGIRWVCVIHRTSV